jgi:hypothetical protein
MSAATRYHVSLLLENGEHPGMQAVVASAEKILATIAEVRKGITFDLAHTNASLETPDRQKLSFDVPYKAHAAISCALTGSKLAQEHLDADIRVSCLSLPSSRLVPGRQIHDGENEDINLKVVFLDRSPGASSQNENFISDDEARRLVATCSAIARRSDIGNTLFISDVETQSGTLANRVSILAPQLMVDACSISTDHLLAPFAQTPASLNGVLLTNRDTGLELVRTAKAMAGVQVTSSRIRSLPDTTDTAAVFSVEIHETASENDHNAIGTVMVVQELLNTMGLCPEARALSNALRRTLDTPAYVGSDTFEPGRANVRSCIRSYTHSPSALFPGSAQLKRFDRVPDFYPSTEE